MKNKVIKGSNRKFKINFDLSVINEDLMSIKKDIENWLIKESEESGCYLFYIDSEREETQVNLLDRDKDLFFQQIPVSSYKAFNRVIKEAGKITDSSIANPIIFITNDENEDIVLEFDD